MINDFLKLNNLIPYKKCDKWFIIDRNEKDMDDVALDLSMVKLVISCEGSKRW